MREVGDAEELGRRDHGVQGAGRWGSGALQGARGGARQSPAGGGAPGAQHGLRTFPARGGAEMRPRAQEGLGRGIQGKTDKRGIKAFATLRGGWSRLEQGLMGLTGSDGVGSGVGVLGAALFSQCLTAVLTNWDSCCYRTSFESLLCFRS